MKILQLFLSGLLLWSSHMVSASYEYPIQNPFAATIIGTPEPLRPTQESLSRWQPDYVKMPAVNSQFERMIEKDYQISIFPERVIPEVFWYEKGGLKYSIAQHKVQAPLIFVIAGTGASYRSVHVKNLQKIFYQAGFHVVAISSPTVPNFLLNASTSSIPGNLLEDSQDIYQVMQRIIKKHGDIKVSDYYLTGYSLGASHAAFVARVDDANTSGEQFQFKKVLLINPPLSLVSSVNILDEMLEDNIPGGLNHFNDYYQKIIYKVSAFYHESEQLGLGREFFFEMFKQNPPSEEQMKAMIGFVFRVASSGMVFSSDVYNHEGYIVPKSKVDDLEASSSLTEYSKVAHRLGFNDYIEHFYLPNFVKKSGLSRQTIIEQSSLESIADYLQNNSAISVMHNLDDPILVPGEIDKLKALFPQRTILYPHGGHLGNINYSQNVNDILEYFLGKDVAANTAAIGEVR